MTPAVTQTTHCPFAQAIRYYWAHTHAGRRHHPRGVPAQRQYTRGDFFDIRRQPLSGQRVAAATHTVTAYVNGVRYTGDHRGILLAEHEDIQLDVGTPIISPEPWTGRRHSFSLPAGPKPALRQAPASARAAMSGCGDTGLKLRMSSPFELSHAIVSAMINASEI